MRTSRFFLSLAASVVFTASASALTLTWEDRDPDTGAGPLKFLSEWNTTYTSTFNLTNIAQPYDPNTMVITSAKVYFAFADDSKSGDAEEKVNIYLDGVSIVSGLEVNGLHPYSSYAWYDFSVTGAALLSLQDDGILDYKVKLKNTNGTNDTYLKIAKLEAEGHLIPPPSVPDHGSVAGLLGGSLLGLAVLRRRLRRE